MYLQSQYLTSNRLAFHDKAEFIYSTKDSADISTDIQLHVTWLLHYPLVHCTSQVMFELNSLGRSAFLSDHAGSLIKWDEPNIILYTHRNLVEMNCLYCFVHPIPAVMDFLFRKWKRHMDERQFLK